jgi:hypothetical protein
LAPFSAIEPDLRAKRVALIKFDAPWMHLSYGLFYPRKRALSRVAQLFVTQLRQVEASIQAREQRALAKIDVRKRARRAATRKTRATDGRKPAAGRRK